MIVLSESCLHTAPLVKTSSSENCYLNFGDVLEPYSEYRMDLLAGGYKVEITKFISDRVQRKIDKYNQKGMDWNLEYLSLDCIATEGVWHSDSEIKSDKLW